VSAPIGIGLVGLGQISRAHRVGYSRASDRAAIVAVCDQDAELAVALAAELGARAYTSIDALLEDDAVSMVDLTLPHDAHFAAATAALAAGRHVLVEKPLAPTSEECRSLIEQARAGGLTLGVAENTRFVTAY
jgi:predicted dehydrogenase